MRRRPSSGSVPDAATPASSPAGRVPAGISVRRTSPAREDEERCSRARRPVRGRTRTRDGRVHYLEMVTASARVTSFQSLILVSSLSQAVRRRGSEESAADAPRSARRRETTSLPPGVAKE
jgi:hypothetical protein